MRGGRLGMIGRLTGRCSKRPADGGGGVQGVGYEVDVPMSTFYHLPAPAQRSRCTRI